MAVQNPNLNTQRGIDTLLRKPAVNDLKAIKKTRAS